MQTGGQAMADRFTYVPTMGFFLAAVGVLPAATRATSGGGRARGCGVRAAVGRELAADRLLARHRHADGAHARGDAAEPVRAEPARARAPGARRRRRRRAPCTRRCSACGPTSRRCEINLGVIAAAQGDHAGAIAHYRRRPRARADVLRGLQQPRARRCSRLQRPQRGARRRSSRRCGCARGDPTALFNLGMAQAADRRPAGAAEAYQTVVALTPDDAEARYRLGVLRLHLGDRDGGGRAAARDARAAARTRGRGRQLCVSCGRRGEAESAPRSGSWSSRRHAAGSRRRAPPRTAGTR